MTPLYEAYLLYEVHQEIFFTDNLSSTDFSLEARLLFWRFFLVIEKSESTLT